VPEPYIPTPFAVRRRWTRRPRVLSAGPCARCSAPETSGRWWDSSEGLICHDCHIDDLSDVLYRPEIIAAEEEARGPDPGPRPEARTCRKCGVEVGPRRSLCDVHRRPAPLRSRGGQPMLTEEQVQAIRADYAAGLRPVDLAAKYGRNRSWLSRIARGHERRADLAHPVSLRSEGRAGG
jgi:hypothetical protein